MRRKKQTINILKYFQSIFFPVPLCRINPWLRNEVPNMHYHRCSMCKHLFKDFVFLHPNYKYRNSSVFFQTSLFVASAVDQSIEEEEIRAQAFVNELNDEFNQRKNIQVRAEWDYGSNITAYNEQRKEKIGAELAEYYKVRG